jgi:hypothetical protein
VSDTDSTVGPVLEDPYALTVSESGILGQDVTLVSSSVSLPYLRIIFILRTFNLWFVYVYLCILASLRIM